MDTGQAIMITMQAIITLVIVPIAICVWRNTISVAEHRRTLYGNGVSGVCKDIDSTKRAVAAIEKTCVMYHGSKDGSDADRKNSADLLRDLSHMIAVLKKKTEEPTPETSG